MTINKTKQLMIDTAFSLFRAKGYDGVTVNDICEACGITKTTFYYYLTSKEEIISYFYQSVTASLAEQLEEAAAPQNYWEQFMAIFDTIIDVSEKIGPDLLGHLFIVNLRDDKGTFDFDENLTHRAVFLIERAQDAGQIRNKSGALPLYRAASHAFEGYDLLWCIKKGGYDRKKILRSSFEEIFDVDPSLRKAGLQGG